jgi:kojibiose phosphorylase
MQERFDPAKEKHFEGAFTQGSGYLHMRGSYEEGIAGASQNDIYMRMPANVTLEKIRNPVSKWGVYLPGIYGNHPMLKEEIINLPYMAAFSVFADGEALDMGSSSVEGYSRFINLRNGVLYRSFVWKTKNAAIKCDYKRFISGKNLLVQEMRYTALSGGCELEFLSDIDERVTTNGYNHFIKTENTARENLQYVTLVTDRGDTVEICGLTASPNMSFCPAKRGLSSRLRISGNMEICVYKLSAISSSRDGCASDLEYIVKNAYKNIPLLFDENSSVWEKKWHTAEVTIEGDDYAQRAVNFSVYHLLRCANHNDSRVAICAKGFAGEAYYGHFFWDTEIYLLPFYLHTNPQNAKSLCEFRINTLPGAKENARLYGYPGARYPWESSVSGLEQCPSWQYADHEVHITADVTFGLWNYYTETGDVEFLKKMAPVFCETARYWLERIEIKPDGAVSLNGVMGPDEYICFCNNNAYTNYMVSFSLKKTLEVLELIRRFDPEFYMSLDISNDLREKIKLAADGLLLKFMRNGAILQCDGFEGLEEPDFENVWKDRSQPYGRFVSQERNYRTKSLKQADALMLPYLFPDKFTQGQLRATYQYYLPYTTHDSSLSRIIHSILCCQLEELDEAYHFFKQSLACDLEGGAAEGIHIANCGGIWQAIVFGFAGMSRSYLTGNLSFSSQLPSHWKSLSFNIIYKNESYFISIRDGEVNISRN